jgi:hypothetical protein
MSSDHKHTKKALEWRRNQVLSKLAKGWTQADIARELQLHPSTISLDVQYLKEQVQKDLQIHIQERLPFEYSRAMTGINAVLQRVSKISDQATDTKTKMDAQKLLMELYKSIMSMATDGGIIEKAMKMVKGLGREDISKVKMSSDEDEDEEITVNDEDEILNEEEEDLREEQ